MLNINSSLKKQLSSLSISIIIPSYNESESLNELFVRIDDVVKKYNLNVEIILVDDGSDDDTQEIVLSYSAKEINSLTYVKLRKNFGKSEALSLGVLHAKNDIILTMDADLQDLPEEIPKLLNAIHNGSDVVSGWKYSRKDPFFGKKIPSYIFNTLVKKVLSIKLHDINCGLKAYRKEVWDEINIYGEFHRFIPALAAQRGFIISEVKVDHHARKFGISKYGASRFFKGIFDLLTVFFLNKYLRRPLHFFGFFGVIFTITGFILALYLTVLWFSGESIGSRPLLMLSVLLIIIGIQIILFGLISQLQVALLNKKSLENYSFKTTTRKFSSKITK